jgi:hypothetical protein
VTVKEYTFSGKLTWGPFESSEKSASYDAKFTWDPNQTTINSAKIKVAFDWSGGFFGSTGLLCPGEWAKAFFNGSLVYEKDWYFTCEHAESDEKDVTDLLQNGDNYIEVRAFNTAIPGGNSLNYTVTFTIDFTGQEPKYTSPTPPFQFPDLTTIIIVIIILVILYFVIRRFVK